MKTMTLTVDGLEITRECRLGATLSDFLKAGGGQVLEGPFLDSEGRRVVAEFTLAHSLHKEHLTSLQEVLNSDPTSALTADDLLAVLS